jgi:hypothetical protein
MLERRMIHLYGRSLYIIDHIALTMSNDEHMIIANINGVSIQHMAVLLYY